MNKLEEYSINRVIAHTIPEQFHKRREMEAYYEGFEAGSQDGFDAAIALDLPVKFAEWKDEAHQKHIEKGVCSHTYIKENSVKLQFLGWELVLLKDGTYYINDTTG